MPSRSLLYWQNESAHALDEIHAAHTSVGGTERGRRYATQQINQAYVVLLSSRFQRFCRDLHTETVAELIPAAPATYQPILQLLTTNRKLDHGNPNPSNIASDFARLGMNIWADVLPMHRHNGRRRQILETLLEWRNAIGHQDFNKPALQGRTIIHLKEVQGYRRALGALAGYFDRAALNHIHAVAGPGAGW